MTENEGIVLLMKKFGGLVAIILGCLLTAFGVEYASTGTTILGAVLLALGVILLALKVIRRNPGDQPG
jgi:uncharacterized YccA/Bax inhibitor family protein